MKSKYELYSLKNGNIISSLRYWGTETYIRFYLEIYYFRFSSRIILMISKFLRKPFNLKALDMHELHISKSSKKFM